MVTAAALYLWPKPTPESVSRRALGCLVAGNFDGVRPFIQDNIRLLGLTEGQARIIVEKYIGPKFAKLAKDGEIIVESQPNSGSAIAIQHFRLRDYALDVSTFARLEENGVVVPFFIDGNAMYAAILAYADLSQRDKRVRVIQTLQKARAELEALGLRGVLRENRLVTWDEVIADREKSLKQHPPATD